MEIIKEWGRDLKQKQSIHNQTAHVFYFKENKAIMA